MSEPSLSSQPAVPRIDDRNWSRLTFGLRIQQLDVEGYLVIPGLLDADHIVRLKEQTGRFETTNVGVRDIEDIGKVGFGCYAAGVAPSAG